MSILSNEEADKKLDEILPTSAGSLSPDQKEMLRYVVQVSFRTGYVSGMKKAMVELRAHEEHKAADLLKGLPEV